MPHVPQKAPHLHSMVIILPMACTPRAESQSDSATKVQWSQGLFNLPPPILGGPVLQCVCVGRVRDADRRESLG